ncbi:MAG: hemerythrin domain-containing protein [Terriglobia bacterium]
MTQCITRYLLDEHHELTYLLNKLSEELRSLPVTRNATQTFERLEKFCLQISRTLHAHLEEEEKVLYPALEEHVEGITATIERMREARDAGEEVEKAFFDCLKRLTQSGQSREAVVQSGRSYIQWVRGHLLNENGRLLPLVERRLDADTQKLVRRAMEELTRETSARVAESFPQGQHS